VNSKIAKGSPDHGVRVSPLVVAVDSGEPKGRSPTPPQENVAIIEVPDADDAGA